MRARFVVAALTLMISAPVHADPPKVAVFDFELVDTSLQGEVNGPRTDEQDRLMRVGDQLRKELTESGKFHLLDISAVNAAAHGSNLQACGGCDVQYAQRLGADLVITGVVQKVSNLILNINIYLRDVHTGASPDVGERRHARQYRRILVACHELPRAQSAARAQLRRSPSLNRRKASSGSSGARHANADDRP